MTYTQYLQATKKRPTAAAALQWLQTQAPAGTPIPAALRAHFGGAARTAQQAAGTPAPDLGAVPAAAPVAAAAPAALPDLVNPNLPSMGLTVQQMLTLPTQYNLQRQQLATQFAGQMSPYIDQPLPSMMPGFDPRTGAADYTRVVGTSPAGDKAYGIQGMAGGGQAYRQAEQGTQHGFASRGVFSGSQVDLAQQQARAALDTQAAQAAAAFAAQQQGVNQSELGAMGNLQTEYARLLSAGNQSVNDLAASMGLPPATAVPAAPAPAAVSAPAAPAAPLQASTPVTRQVASTVGTAANRVATGASTLASRLTPAPAVHPAQQSPLRQVSGGVSPQRQAGTQPRPTRRTTVWSSGWGGQWR